MLDKKDLKSILEGLQLKFPPHEFINCPLKNLKFSLFGLFASHLTGNLALFWSLCIFKTIFIVVRVASKTIVIYCEKLIA